MLHLCLSGLCDSCLNPTMGATLTNKLSDLNDFKYSEISNTEEKYK